MMGATLAKTGEGLRQPDEKTYAAPASNHLPQRVPRQR
jgi:hypothetical protein